MLVIDSLKGAKFVVVSHDSHIVDSLHNLLHIMFSFLFHLCCFLVGQSVHKWWGSAAYLL